MKEGWEYKSLGDVCEILDSRRKPITKNKRESGTIPYYGATGILDYVKDYIFDEKLVLLGEDGAKWGAGENSAYIVEGKTWVNNHAHALRPKREHLIDELLVYYLNFANLQPFITGVTVPKLNQEKMRSIEIPVPPLSEQQSIVDYLDSAFAKIDALKANAEKALNEAKALFQASLKEMLEPKEGWEEKTIEHFARIVHGKNQKEVLDSNGSYPIYGSGGNIMGYANAYLCEAGTTILGRKGTIDNPLFIDERFWNVDTAFGIIAKDNCNKKYLYYSIKKVDWAKLNTGTTLPSLTQNVVYNVAMCAPPLSEQQSIVETLDSLKSKVDRLQENYDKISQECDALKQTILRQVFE